MAGRRPKPTQLKILQGNPGRRPLNQKEPQPSLDKPEKPERLGHYGDEVWDELLEELFHMRVMTKADRRALELGCRAYQEYRDALNQKGRKRSWQAISDGWKRFRSILVEFGLTPSSRSKVEMLPDRTPDPLEEFLTGKRQTMKGF